MTAKKTNEVKADGGTEDIRTRAEHFISYVDAVGQTVTLAEKDPTTIAGGLQDVELADAIATIQDLRARLVNVERDLATALGKRSGKTVGTLPDGRQFKLDRATDRTAWDHDEWKRDARRVIAGSLSERFIIHSHDDAALVDTASGEEVTLGRVLQEAMTAIQEVHGATSPKSTALKGLGLYASDYCSSTPSGWRFSAVKPTPKTDTTPTTEEPTNA